MSLQGHTDSSRRDTEQMSAAESQPPRGAMTILGVGCSEVTDRTGRGSAFGRGRDASRERSAHRPRCQASLYSVSPNRATDAVGSVAGRSIGRGIPRRIGPPSHGKKKSAGNHVRGSVALGMDIGGKPHYVVPSSALGAPPAPRTDGRSANLAVVGLLPVWLPPWPVRIAPRWKDQHHADDPSSGVPSWRGRGSS
jgi:hypothetical protein